VTKILPPRTHGEASVLNASHDAEGEAAVRLEHVSVQYRIPHERISSLKEYAIRWLQRRIVYTDFLALSDISLSVEPGEVFGIVGPNGAGKTTMLRVIARVLRPTTGRVRVWGSVAPLLEVGAGFHPELTGRENIYFNAALLGHPRSEIVERLEAIIDFAELREFIDAPLRTYSSGMWARLGFAVATAWEPEILLVDEVLAVGDESFRAKCEARIAAYRQRNATVLLVAHNLALVRNLCQRAVWLDRGHVRAIGPAAEVIEQYRTTVRNVD
jgi:ABC-type polysaccharide/polyol phosphate transport system ATPase subunit